MTDSFLTNRMNPVVTTAADTAREELCESDQRCQRYRRTDRPTSCSNDLSYVHCADDVHDSDHEAPHTKTAAELSSGDVIDYNNLLRDVPKRYTF